MSLYWAGQHFLLAVIDRGSFNNDNLFQVIKCQYWPFHIRSGIFITDSSYPPYIMSVILLAHGPLSRLSADLFLMESGVGSVSSGDYMKKR